MFMQIALDWMTEMQFTAKKNWRKFGFHTMLNVGHVRILHESVQALRAWRMDSTKIVP
eukprot:COSAG02_NODE_62088_length_267_cov_0.416667_1_plen_57_part_01